MQKKQVNDDDDYSYEFTGNKYRFINKPDNITYANIINAYLFLP